MQWKVNGNKEKNWRQLGDQKGGCCVTSLHQMGVQGLGVGGSKHFQNQVDRTEMWRVKSPGLGNSGIRPDGVATNWRQAGRREGQVLQLLAGGRKTGVATAGDWKTH